MSLSCWGHSAEKEEEGRGLSESSRLQVHVWHVTLRSQQSDFTKNGKQFARNSKGEISDRKKESHVQRFSGRLRPFLLSPHSTLLRSALQPGHSAPRGRGNMPFSPLASSWICPIRSLSRRPEGGRKAKSEDSSLSSLPARLLGASCVPQQKTSACLKETHSAQLSLLWILVKFPSPCPISAGVVTALVLRALGS